MSYEAVLKVARDAARAAVALHASRVGTVGTERWSEKAVADFVTDVDRDAEACIVDRIRSAFPDHAILAEEASTDGGRVAGGLPDAEWVWIVDPLDGTTNFLHRYPMYAASIGVVHGGVLAAGVVHCGPAGDEWWATRAGGAFRNGSRIAVSTIERLPHALIGTGFPFKTLERLDEYLGQFAAVLRSTAGIRRAGAAAVDLCHVATGWLDGFWELSLAPWDVAAGALIAREAGGIVTRPDGDPEVVGPGPILAGNPAIHAALGRLLDEAGAASRNA